jgi:hypothetical protein
VKKVGGRYLHEVSRSNPSGLTTNNLSPWLIFPYSLPTEKEKVVSSVVVVGWFVFYGLFCCVFCLWGLFLWVGWLLGVGGVPFLFGPC